MPDGGGPEDGRPEMADLGPPLGPGDRAPDFDLPAADRDGRLSLSDHYRRGPVLLLLRGLYCAFCRHISRNAAEVLREMRVDGGGDPVMTFHHHGGWEDTAEDEAEFRRPLQSVGYYLVDRGGVIRWARTGEILSELPQPASLLALV